MIKIFKNLNRKQWLLVAISVVLIVGQVYLDLKLPDYMSAITEIISTSGQESELWINGGYMLACALGSALLSVCVCFCAGIISSGLAATLRFQIFRKIQNFSSNEIKKFSTASLITRTTNDVTQVQNTVAFGFQALIKAPILAVWAIVKILGKSWQWSTATAVAVCVLLITIIAVALIAVPKFKIIQSRTDDLNRVTRENLIGLRVVRAYNAENYQQEKFEKANKKLTRTHLFVGRVMQIMSPIMSLVMSGLSLAIYLIGAFIINNAGLTERLGLYSDMIVFSSYALQVVLAFMLLIMIFIMLPRAIVSARRINEVVDTESSIKYGDFCGDTDIKGEVEFKNVCFKYPDADDYVLKDISFVAHAGQTVAFIGSTGSGKSTLINLVPRFYDASSGKITIDGKDIKEYDEVTLNNKLGYVSQKAILFAGDIRNNVNFGQNATGQVNDDDINMALKISESTEFVEKVGGVNAKISQSGTNVSGGQKQRLSIARAVARKPEIIIFDDSFSALDYKTDKKLRSNLKKYMKDATKLIVAQRIGTIKDADLIIVLDEGEMVGAGTHEQLLKSCKVYKEIVLSQLSEEELHA